jgi:hypothetical protein
MSAKWIAAGENGLPTVSLPAPIPCQGKCDEIANDNAQRCRRSGVAIDPMFLN